MSHILTSRKLEKENEELREQMVCLAWIPVPEFVDPQSAKALVASRRIIEKCIGWVLKKDI